MWKLRHRFEQQSNDGAGGGGGAPSPSPAAPAPSPAPSPSPAPAWYGSDANKAVVEAKQFKTVDEVFNWGVNAEKLIGAERAGRTRGPAEGRQGRRRHQGLPLEARRARGGRQVRAPVPEGQDGGFAKVASTMVPRASACRRVRRRRSPRMERAHRQVHRRQRGAREGRKRQSNSTGSRANGARTSTRRPKRRAAS
jgi:hypothetical protein